METYVAQIYRLYHVSLYGGATARRAEAATSPTHLFDV